VVGNTIRYNLLILLRWPSTVKCWCICNKVLGLFQWKARELKDVPGMLAITPKSATSLWGFDFRRSCSLWGEYSINLREYSINFREHSVNFREHGETRRHLVENFTRIETRGVCGLQQENIDELLTEKDEEIYALQNKVNIFQSL
jgi:hypothetical protein